MAASDLYIRSRPKLQSSDLWLHPAGASGAGPPPVISRSGTLEAVASFTALEAIADGGVVQSFVTLSSAPSIADAGVLTTIATLSAGEALADSNTLTTSATLTATYSAFDPSPGVVAVGVIEADGGATAAEWKALLALHAAAASSRFIHAGGGRVATSDSSATSSVRESSSGVRALIE